MPARENQHAASLPAYAHTEPNDGAELTQHTSQVVRPSLSQLQSPSQDTAQQYRSLQLRSTVEHLYSLPGSSTATWHAQLPGEWTEWLLRMVQGTALQLARLLSSSSSLRLELTRRLVGIRKTRCLQTAQATQVSWPVSMGRLLV